MKKVLLIVFGMMSFAVADIHPGLKNAIDKGDVKTAENLVKKFNINDIYCPASLSYEDGLKIYGSSFSNNPSKLWEICDPVSIKSAEKNVCKTSIPLCKYYLRNLLQDGAIDVLDSVFEDILQSKLYIQKTKKQVKQFKTIKATKEECIDQLETARLQKVDSIISWYRNDCKDYLGSSDCPQIFSRQGLTSIDSINKIFSSKSKLCKKNPTKTDTSYVEQDFLINPFLFDIEYYGILLSKKLKNPFYSNLKSVTRYKELKRVKDFGEVIEDKVDIVSNIDFAAYCLAFSNKKDKVGGVCRTTVEKYAGNINLVSDKNAVIKELSNVYATSGFVSDSLITFSCKLYPKIDKDFYEVMEVNVFDCNVVGKYNSENEKCANSSINYIQTFSSGITYACDNNKWRALKQRENEYGVCSNEGDKKDKMYCAQKIGWIKNAGYETFVDNRDNTVYRAIKIGNQIWMAENLNYKAKKSRCYDDDKENCDKYGRLYTWYSIMSENDNGCMEDGGKECFEKSPIQGICPNGWHLPSKKDFEKLKAFLEKNNLSLKSLNSIDEWSNKNMGTDSYGFNAYPVGIWCLNRCTNDKQEDVYFNGKGYNTSFWSSSIYKLDRYYLTPYAFDPNHNDYESEGLFGGDDRYGRLVRCLKDSEPKSDKNAVKKVETKSSYASFRIKQAKQIKDGKK